MGNLVGRSLAHFRIDAELGEGGMGVVYRATRHRRVASSARPRTCRPSKLAGSRRTRAPTSFRSGSSSSRCSRISKDAILGHALVEAGRTTDALPLLREASRSCGVLEQYDPFVILRVQARLDLAEALAKQGNTTEACEWLGKIVTQWGQAKPRSVQAGRAKERARVLGCPR
jgi:hypothetical protein